MECNHFRQLDQTNQMTVARNFVFLVRQRIGSRCQGCNKEEGVLKCLHCVSTGCVGRTNSHALVHSESNMHLLWFESGSSCVFCFGCEGIVESPFWRNLILLSLNDFGFVPRGIYNLGNTCYLNSILQAGFIVNPLLRRFFLSGGHQSELCNKERKQLDDGLFISDCLACSFDSIFQSYFRTDSRGIPLIPTAFLYSIWKDGDRKGSLFLSGGMIQQDAHEIFIRLLDGLHDLFLTYTSSCSCVIHKTFSGSLISSLRCLGCNDESRTVDSFFDLSLAVSASLVSSISRFLSPERLDDHDQTYSCAKCKSSAIIKQLVLLYLPNVLILHLKRFEQKGVGFGKIDSRIVFPLSLDMGYWMNVSEAGGSFYELYAIIVHYGVLDSGHYVSYVCVGKKVESIHLVIVVVSNR